MDGCALLGFFHKENLWCQREVLMPQSLTQSHSHLLANTFFTSVWVRGLDDSDVWPVAVGQSLLWWRNSFPCVWSLQGGTKWRDHLLPLFFPSYLLLSTNLLASPWVCQPLLPTQKCQIDNCSKIWFDIFHHDFDHDLCTHYEDRCWAFYLENNIFYHSLLVTPFKSNIITYYLGTVIRYTTHNITFPLHPKEFVIAYFLLNIYITSNKGQFLSLEMYTPYARWMNKLFHWCMVC